MAKKNELAAPGAAGTALAAIPTGGVQDGFLDDDRDVLKLPVAQLLQALSPACRDGLPGAKEGVLWNPLASEPLPKRFVPIRWLREAILWRSREEGGGIVQRSTDFTDPDVMAGIKWDGEIPPTWTEHLNCAVLFEGFSMPVILSWSKTGLATGKRLYSLTKLLGGSLWTRSYEWVGEERKVDKNRWFVLGARPAGPSDPTTMATAASLGSLFNVGKVVADLGGRETDSDGGLGTRE